MNLKKYIDIAIRKEIRKFTDAPIDEAKRLSVEMTRISDIVSKQAGTGGRYNEQVVNLSQQLSTEAQRAITAVQTGDSKRALSSADLVKRIAEGIYIVIDMYVGSKTQMARKLTVLGTKFEKAIKSAI